MVKVTHLTSVHQRYDTRIFLKQCKSLANNGYDVTLVVADGKGDEVKDGISILDAGKPASRLRRMFLTTRKVYHLALKTDAAIYHLHDPELIPAGLVLLRKGKKVIFDSHEDIPLQFIDKPYLSKPFQVLFFKAFSLFERITCKMFNTIVTATPYIRKKFESINSNVVDINNYPSLSEMDFGTFTQSRKKNQVCYIGWLSQVRGTEELISSAGFIKTNTSLLVAGKFSELDFEKRVKHLPEWGLIDFRSFLIRDAVIEVLQESIAGLVNFLPSPNHLDAQPNKMFEYMSAGLPVIASDFPLWKEIIEGNQCGICVNPSDPQAIAAAIDYLAGHPQEAEEMGKRGRKAVEEKYNWETEEAKLLALYGQLLNAPD